MGITPAFVTQQSSAARLDYKIVLSTGRNAEDSSQSLSIGFGPTSQTGHSP